MKRGRGFRLALSPSALLLCVCAACSSGPKRENPVPARPLKVAAVPFTHWKGPYFGESCRRDFVERFAPLASGRAVFAEPEKVREAIRALTGREDFDLSDSSAAAVARALGAEFALAGTCRLQLLGARLVEAGEGRIVLDAVAPVKGTERAFALGKLARRVAQEWPCPGCPGVSNAAARGYLRPRSVAVLPVVNEAGDPAADVPARVLCNAAFKRKGLRTADLSAIDLHLRESSRGAEALALDPALRTDAARALDVDALALLKVKRFGSAQPGAARDRRVEVELTVYAPAEGLSWTAAGLGGKRGLALSSQEALQDSFVDLAEEILVGPLDTVHRSELAQAFDVAWRQLPTWLQ